MTQLEYLVTKTRAARDGGLGALSTGEALLAALVLNRADWLANLGYTIAEALDRVDADSISLIPAIARMIAETDGAIAQAQANAREESAIRNLMRDSDVVDVNATLVTYGDSPGYRHLSLTFDLERLGSTQSYRMCLHVSADDSMKILRHIVRVNQYVWDRSEERGPIDIKGGEERPKWLDRF